MAKIGAAVAQVPTRHRLLLGDARHAVLPAESVHLVLTSPPYWTLKEYRRAEGQLGWVADSDEFLDQLDAVWRVCHRALVPGGRLICVVGDVCLSRRKNSGRHTVVPLHASIQERCRSVGFDNLAPIIWHKIANAAHEVERGTGGFLGKPYEPNAVIKNDVEFILMERKAGGYRRPSRAARTLSLLSEASFRTMFRQVWTDVAGASTRDHPAPYPGRSRGASHQDVQLRRRHGSGSLHRDRVDPGGCGRLRQELAWHRGRPGVLRTRIVASTPARWKSAESYPNRTGHRRP